MLFPGRFQEMKMLNHEVQREDPLLHNREIFGEQGRAARHEISRTGKGPFLAGWMPGSSRPNVAKIVTTRE